MKMQALAAWRPLLVVKLLVVKLLVVKLLGVELLGVESSAVAFAAFHNSERPRPSPPSAPACSNVRRAQRFNDANS